MSSHPISPLDSAFLTLEVPSTPLQIGAVVELALPDDSTSAHERFDRVRQVIAERIHEIPVLAERVLRPPFDLGWPIRVGDPDFHVDHHVKFHGLPDHATESDLLNFIANLMAAPLPADQPLWDLWYIDHTGSSTATVLMRVHHALADGVSGAATFAGLFDITPEVRAPSPGGRVAPGPLPTPESLIPQVMSDLVHRPVAIVETLTAGLSRLAYALESLVSAPHEPKEVPSLLSAPRTSLNGTPSSSRILRREVVSLAQVKQASKQRGGSVTAWVMAVTGGALRRYCLERGDDLERDLVAYVPINVRADGAEAHLGNQISAMLLYLGATQPDPNVRFSMITDAVAHQAQTSREKSGRLLMNLASAVGPTLTSLAGKVAHEVSLFDHLPTLANVTVSSVPGPPIPLWLGGHEVKRVTPVGPLLASLALNVTVISYCDNLEFGVLGCGERFADLDHFMGLLRDEAALLLADPSDTRGASANM